MSEAALPIITTEEENKHVPLSQQSPFRKWAGLGVLSLGLAIIIIDTTLLNVSLSTIIKDLHTDLQSIQWVITAYALMLAAFTITGGRLGDLFGRKKMFMFGAVVFAVGSFMASEAHMMRTMLLGESIIEGIGAALMMPATASLVVANFHGPDRAKAFGVWGGVAGASSAIGPLLGGYLTSHYSWRWGFRINILVAALVIIGSILFIKDSRDEQHKPTLDIGGIIFSALGLLGITYGIIESETYGWWKAKAIWSLGNYQFNLNGFSITPIAIALGIVFLVLFVLWERRVEEKGKMPLVYLDLFKNRQFTSGAVTVSILTLGMSGLIFALPIFLQAVKSLSAFDTGLAMLPLSLALLIMAPVSGALSKKIPAKYLIQAGLALDVIGMFILRAAIKVDMPVSHLIPGLALYGAGMGMVMAPISNLTLSAVPIQQAGEASGVNNTLRQVGSTLGAAIIGAAVLTSLTGSLAKGIQNSPAIPDAAKTQIAASVSGASSNVEFGDSSIPEGTPDSIKNEISALVKQAAAQSTKDAYVYAAMIILIGFAVSQFLPKTDIHAHENGQSVVDESEYNHSKQKYAAAAAIIIVALAGGSYMLHQSSAKTISTGATGDNLADIQNAFLPPVPPPSSATSTQENQAAISSPANAATSTPHAAPGGTSTPSAVPTITYYTNTNLGFKMTLLPTWQAQEKGQNQVAFVSQSGQYGSVQVYVNPGVDLAAIKIQLQGSPSVSSVTETTYQGEPALSFTTTSGQQGIAVIHGNKLYYIMGTLTTEPFTTFNFM